MEKKAAALYLEAKHNVHRRTDRMFAYLMLLQWLAGITAALVISPRTWLGTSSQASGHVWAAIFLGGAITSLPVFLAWKNPGAVLTRHTIAIAQMLYSALLIHLTGGRIETHFHVFGSLAFLAIYRDWRVLLSGTIVVVLDHVARGIFWPQSIFGILTPSHWRWLEHAGWVLFEDTFLVIAGRQSLRDMYDVATREANLEATNARIEEQVKARTAELSTTMDELKRSEERFASAFENAAIGMALVSPAGQWLKANHALISLIGYSAEELYRTDFQEITHPDDLAPNLRLLTQLLAGEVSSYQLEKRYYHKQGGIVWVLLSVSLVRDDAGLPVHFISQIQDITERKRAEARLENINKELLGVSRQAGMAEVATSVLHNVGNVLNSVNISCAVVSERVRKSRISSVVKTAGLLHGQKDDLAGFFTSNPAGRQLPDFLGKLAERLTEEQTEILLELQLLGKNIDHIKDIVSLQQNYSKVSGVTETVHMKDLVEDSLRMNDGALLRHAVRVIREYAPDTPPIALEKHKALQILVNLIRNAKHACDDSGHLEKIVTVRVSGDARRVRVDVIDNGIGIPAGNLTRIFAHGFTTKTDGHGFGLHSGALAAQEMGGSLTVYSAGTGAGATFTLELPTTPPASLAPPP